MLLVGSMKQSWTRPSVTTDATLAALKQQSENGNSDRSRSGDGSDFGSHAPGGHPEKSWSEIMPELQALNLSPTSLKAIANNIKSPQPLDTLLNQLNRDFAVPLLAQCYRIAQLDGKTSAVEAKVNDRHQV